MCVNEAKSIYSKKKRGWSLDKDKEREENVGEKKRGIWDDRKNKSEKEKEMEEEDREGGKEVASNLITQINVAWREQLPKWTKKREREG